uniref:Paralemmin n=1 Tax=Knipowitschia caucasica TaxID=637954 RepID=A0AAV2KKU0_KNICA
MAQRIYHEGGKDGRSVLGMLAVQVEKDPKTGASIVRSVTPVSGAAGPQVANSIFDDGRKSIHAVGGSAAQPSSEELGQILSVIDGVGMTALLGEVTVTPTPETVKAEDSQKSQENDLSFSTVNHSKGPDIKGPVTLMFMGYTDGRADAEEPGAEPQGMLTAERVIITDEGEELVLGQDSAAPPQKDKGDMTAQKAAKESQDAPLFQDVPLGGANEAKPREGGENGQQKPEHVAEPQEKSKCKACQCCTVM